MSSVEWRPVRGYEGQYEISTGGAVRTAKAQRAKPLHSEIAAYMDRRGRRQVKVTDSTGKRRWIFVARAVWEAFIEPLTAATSIGFADGNPANCTLDNLTSESQSSAVRRARLAKARATAIEARKGRPEVEPAGLPAKPEAPRKLKAAAIICRAHRRYKPDDVDRDYVRRDETGEGWGAHRWSVVLSRQDHAFATEYRCQRCHAQRVDLLELKRPTWRAAGVSGDGRKTA